MPGGGGLNTFGMYGMIYRLGVYTVYRLGVYGMIYRLGVYGMMYRLGMYGILVGYVRYIGWVCTVYRLGVYGISVGYVRYVGWVFTVYRLGVYGISVGCVRYIGCVRYDVSGVCVRYDISVGYVRYVESRYDIKQIVSVPDNYLNEESSSRAYFRSTKAQQYPYVYYLLRVSIPWSQLIVVLVVEKRRKKKEKRRGRLYVYFVPCTYTSYMCLAFSVDLHTGAPLV